MGLLDDGDIFALYYRKDILGSEVKEAYREFARRSMSETWRLLPNGAVLTPDAPTSMALVIS